MADCDCLEQGSEDLKSCIQDVSTLARSNGADRTPEELVARAIAPVKKEFLGPPPVRNSSADAANAANEGLPDSSKTNGSQSQTGLVKEKKSKRQLKRERQQEKKSVQHLCPEIAKTSDLSSCPYKDNCRFSHDLEAFKAQKPADLEGECPFLGSDEPCPYGLTCRFAGTHKDGGTLTGSSSSHKKITEMNGLKKDVQKLLWKNKVQFPKAEAQLKALGLSSMKPKNEKIEKLLDGEESDLTLSSNGNIGNGKSCETIDALPDKLDHLSKSEAEGNGENLVSDELRPVKRLKNEQEDDGSVVEEGSTVIKEPEENSSGIKGEISADSSSAATMESLKTHPREKKLIDFRDKLYLAPLTTVGNLPFRRVCKYFGADITCGEMAMCTNLLQGQASEWALLRRHSSEDIFGVQICGAYPDTVARAVELIEKECTVDFIDINMGCPIDLVVNKGAGSALLTKPARMKSVIQASSGIVDTPITIKVRTGYFEGKNRIDSLIADIGSWGATAVTIHGRTRQQRYSKLADWDYVYKCIEQAPESLQVLGNGDVFSYLDWNKHKSDCPKLSSCMIARGALVKPWIFTEIKEQRHWDITSGERLNILKDYVRFGLQHWGSDKKGVETTRHFLLELLSYTCRYVPVGLLDVIPQQLNWRPPSYFGRDDLETLMASESGADWVRISEMLLGKVPDGFTFTPKHKSNSYDKAENG